MNCTNDTCSPADAPAKQASSMKSSNPSSADITVDVISDSSCPWCFIGKRRLERALAKLSSDVSVDVKWHPFQLDSARPRFPNSLVKLDMYKERLGSDARVREMIAHVSANANAENIDLKFGGNAGNTFDSHRLVYLAYKIGGTQLQDKAVEAVFKAYFEENVDISNPAVLKKIGDDIGLESSKVDELLSSDLYRKEVQHEISQAKGRVSGVPHFTISNKKQQYVLSGGQEPEAFLQIFHKLGVKFD